MKSIVTLLLFTLITYQVSAQENKEGWFFGTAIGLSQLSFNNETIDFGKHTNLSFPNFKVGKMINAKSAFLLYLPGSIYTFTSSGRERDRGFEAILPSYQHWFHPKSWLMASVGVAMDAPAFYDITDGSERKFYFGLGAAATFGYEFIQFGNKNFDIQSRVYYGSVDYQNTAIKGLAFSILIGFNIF